MRLQALVFLGAAAARGIFEHIYSLGDSISDNGNYYTISGGTTPGPEYFKGRFSNGPTWVEYLARTLEAKLRVLAFGKATSDSKQFAVDNQLDVPGCIQQAESLIFEYNQKEKTTPGLKDHTLVTLAFLGNDFFDPKASAAAVSKNLERCASTILSHTSIKHMLIPTSSAPELFPYFQQDPSQLPLLKQSAAELETSWKATLNHLKSANPKVTFYNLNFRDVMYSIKNGTSPFLTRPFDNTDTPCFTPGKPKCSRPDTHMFFDGLHPTTKTHMIIAKAAAAILPQQPKLRMLRHA